MENLIVAALAVVMASEPATVPLPTVLRGHIAPPHVEIAQVPSPPIAVRVCVRRPNSIAGLTLTRCRDVGTLR
jgi:hypothetical protein